MINIHGINADPGLVGVFSTSVAIAHIHCYYKQNRP